MTTRDGAALAASFGYVVLVLGGAALLARTRLPARDRRSLVHATVGLWIVPTVFLFDTRWWAMLPPVVFVLANALRRPRRLYRALEEGAGLDFGLVLFPAAVAGVIGLFWWEPVRPAVFYGRQHPLLAVHCPFPST